MRRRTKLRSQLLWSDEFRCEYWTQDLFGHHSTYLDAVHGFVAPSVAAHSSTDNGNDISTWAILAIIAGAVGACALLTVMLRRHLDVGRPASV